MGNLVNGIFSFCLGWVRTAVYGLWNAAGQGRAAEWLAWVGENWLFLAVLFCAAGTLTDILVHMLRWRPYWVWTSFLHRIISGKKEKEEEKQRRAERVYQPERIAPVYAETAYQVPSVAYHQGISSQLREDEHQQAAESVQEPEYVNAVPEEAYRNDRDMSDDRLGLRERLRSLPRNWGIAQEEEEDFLHYRAARPDVSEREAYHDPVYPPDWQPPAGGR